MPSQNYPKHIPRNPHWAIVEFEEDSCKMRSIVPTKLGEGVWKAGDTVTLKWDDGRLYAARVLHNVNNLNYLLRSW